MIALEHAIDGRRLSVDRRNTLIDARRNFLLLLGDVCDLLPPHLRGTTDLLHLLGTELLLTHFDTQRVILRTKRRNRLFYGRRDSV